MYFMLTRVAFLKKALLNYRSIQSCTFCVCVSFLNSMDMIFEAPLGADFINKSITVYITCT